MIGSLEDPDGEVSSDINSAPMTTSKFIYPSVLIVKLHNRGIQLVIVISDTFNALKDKVHVIRGVFATFAFTLI